MDSPHFLRISSWIPLHILGLVSFFSVFVGCRTGLAQPFPYYYAAYGHANGSLIHNSLTDEYHCTDCSFFKHAKIGKDFGGGISFGPDDSLYILSVNPDATIYQVNSISAVPTLVMQGPVDLVDMGGFVAMGNGIFYSIPRPLQPSQSLFKWDVAADTVIAIGQLNYRPTGEMWMANGELYYLSAQPGVDLKIIRLNLADPASSEIALILPKHFQIEGLTASPVGNIFIGIEEAFFPGTNVVSVNLIDGTVKQICSIAKVFGGHAARHMASRYEHSFHSIPVYMDLDCNNSSLAPESDFNAVPFTCFTEGGVPVSDFDIKMMIDAYVSKMTVTLMNPLNGSEEILLSTGNVSGIIVSGSGTTSITLESEGSARITEFEEALRLIQYDNFVLNPAAGIREVHVQFETFSGTLSNVATAFINVQELPAYLIDLGPDIELCEGSTVEIEASTLFVNYNWSTGANSQSIQVSGDGTFSITVSGALRCPAADTIEVKVIPVINVSLSGDLSVCEGEEATLIVTSDAPFPIEVEITSDPGSVQLLSDIVGSITFYDSPFGITEYYITNIVSSESACISDGDFEQVIEIVHDVHSYTAVSLCEGDSILLGNEWESDPGDYTVPMQTLAGCDSVVHYALNIMPVEKIFIQNETCDSTLAGIFLSYITGSAGCDTLVTTTTLLTLPDTNHLQLTSCRASDAGVFLQILQNQAGCDSVVVSAISWVPPGDSTVVFHATCDSSQFGTFAQVVSGHDGCDSIVVTHVIPGNPFTTQLHLTSCDSVDLGVFENHLQASNGCDSVVFTTVTYADEITTTVISGSCDASQVGVFIHTYSSVFGCDSIVTHTVTLLQVSETFISTTSCDPAEAGSFVHLYSNVNGCDSTVYETVALLPHSETQVSRASCLASEVGVFIHTLTNQYGCDSVVTEIVSLQAGDTSLVTQYTCDPAQTGRIETIYTAHDGCDSLVIHTTTLFSLPGLDAIITSDFNGYAVSCEGAYDGAAMAIGIGTGPWSYQWSTGNDGQWAMGLAAGNYEVTVTDGNGCSAADNIVLHAPEAIEMELDIVQPDCIGQHYGHITVQQNGGIQPVTYSVNGNPFQTSPEFTAIAPGAYTLSIIDGNQCTTEEAVLIETPIDVHVELGDDRIIRFGESLSINAIVNIPYDSIESVVWDGLLSPDCPQCLTQFFSPSISTTYVVSVTSHEGCVARDTIQVIVKEASDIFIPNVFSPNGDGSNDRFVITSEAEIEEIESLHIFDRWGTLVFAAHHVLPGDPSASWDGSMGGEPLNSAVFVYSIIFRFSDGRQELRQGDITLIR